MLTERVKWGNKRLFFKNPNYTSYAYRNKWNWLINIKVNFKRLGAGKAVSL